MHPQDDKTQPWFYDIKDFAAKFRLKLLGGGKACCPTCGRWNQMYRRQLNNAMCRQLIKLYKLRDTAKWIHAGDVILKGCSGPGDFSKLKHWEMIEAKPHEADDKKASGYWRITPVGVRFVLSQILLPPTACLLNDELIALEGDPISIRQALTTKFSYTDLMEA